MQHDSAWLAHERRGSGPPLVLVHGLGSQWQVWQPVLSEVARHRDVIAVDLPGFGASPMWPDVPAGGPVPGSVQHLADRVVAFLDALGVHRPEVAGNSLGGGVALELGRRGLVRSVTAFAPVGCWHGAGRRWCQSLLGVGRSLSNRLEPALPRLFATRPGRTVLCGALYARPARLAPDDCVTAAAALAGAPGFTAARAALDSWRLTAADPGALVGMPVTVAWGTRDLVLPYRSQARRARAALPNARHVTLRDCGHLPFADDPATCARLLTQRQ